MADRGNDSARWSRCLDSRTADHSRGNSRAKVFAGRVGGFDGSRAIVTGGLRRCAARTVESTGDMSVSQQSVVDAGRARAQETVRGVSVAEGLPCQVHRRGFSRSSGIRRYVRGVETFRFRSYEGVEVSEYV